MHFNVMCAEKNAIIIQWSCLHRNTNLFRMAIESETIPFMTMQLARALLRAIDLDALRCSFTPAPPPIVLCCAVWVWSADLALSYCAVRQAAFGHGRAAERSYLCLQGGLERESETLCHADPHTHTAVVWHDVLLWALLIRVIPTSWEGSRVKLMNIA